MIGIMNIQAQELALGDDRQTGYVKKKVEINNLKTLIKKLEPMYEVSIVCNSDLVHTKIAYEVSDRTKSVEEHLTKLTSKSNLSYHKLDKGFYVITDKEEKRAANSDAVPIAIPYTKSHQVGKKEASKVAKVEEERITGTVSSKNGETLPGVNVLLKGTNIGTVTDMDGKFVITAPNTNGTLIFSFIGFTSQEIPIAGRSIIDVTMVDESQALGEVVVTAFGLERKKNRWFIQLQK
ncbi:TonB-dependent receptor [Cyclobacterium qasimii M12-11B]|uniref:TonB-dependent receptor n=2 Tax=Cyclobacterium qasimii TaxID=1350429 RepID=S7WKR6_9BACT|nr:TonB-dependent receptor [Cyclobacterium qasimii M12-11B]